MKIMKLRETMDIELPERHGNEYINVRSNERTDVRPGETRSIHTGIKLIVEPGDRVAIDSVYTNDYAILPPGTYKDLQIIVVNDSDRNIMIYPGQDIATIKILKDNEPLTATVIKRPRKKRATIESSATLNDTPQEPGFYKKPCNGCK